MADKSSYLRFLPPVLWKDEPAAPEFSLGAALRVFEKILTGIDDGVPITHVADDGTPRTHEAVGSVVARLHRLYDPWTTPPQALEWLASWVSLEFAPFWDEYQRRKVTSEIVEIYRRRGLKRGLDEYLDLFTVAEKRPRVAVDDGVRLAFSRPEPGRFASVDALVAHGPSARADGTLAHRGMVRPTCIAYAPDGRLVVGDAGTPTYWPATVDEAVWAIPAPGRYEYGGTPRAPSPLGPSPWDAANPGAPVFPKAIAVDDPPNWSIYVVDGVANNAQAALYKLPSPGFAPVAKLATKGALGTRNPIAMVHLAGHLYILDRGNTGNPPRIIDFNLATSVATPHVLASVIEPLSLALLGVGPNAGDLVVGDGGQQNAATPGDLVRVALAAGTWAETSLLGALPAGTNPLVAPTGVCQLASGRLMVLDAGVKPLQPGATDPDPFNRLIAEPAALYAVDLATAPPGIARASETKCLVTPRAMATDGEQVFVCDAGEPEIAGMTPRVFRALSHEFAAVVHFSQQRPTTQLERRRIVGNIRDIVDHGKPAQTAWSVLTAV